MQITLFNTDNALHRPVQLSQYCKLPHDGFLGNWIALTNEGNVAAKLWRNSLLWEITTSFCPRLRDCLLISTSSSKAVLMGSPQRGAFSSFWTNCIDITDSPMIFLILCVVYSESLRTLTTISEHLRTISYQLWRSFSMLPFCLSFTYAHLFCSRQWPSTYGHFRTLPNWLISCDAVIPNSVTIYYMVWVGFWKLLPHDFKMNPWQPRFTEDNIFF